MDLHWRDSEVETRFEAYVDGLSACLGHQDRVIPFRSYCTGLLLDGERKSVEPMAAQLRPDRTSAEHQSLLHFVGQSPWSSDGLLRAVRDAVVPAMTKSGPIAAWMIDDTSFPKKGAHSVGVTRQYSGQLGKQDNCQVAVSLSVATADASLPIAWRLYLPDDWAADPNRRKTAKVPEDVAFRTKHDIALAQIRDAMDADVPTGIVLADAGYGNKAAWRDEIAALGLDFVVGVLHTTTVWPPGMVPTVPARSGAGRRPKNLRRGGDDAPIVQVHALAAGLPAEAWQTVTWREGSAGDMTSRFAAVRVRPAQGDHRRAEPRPEHWLLIQWLDDEDDPKKFKYWLSTLPAEMPVAELVRHAKHRWLIERDYLELKQELGLGHFEGRGWRGFHHHAALCIAAYGFLVAERAAIPPSARNRAPLVKMPDLPNCPRPRGAPNPHSEAHAPFHHDTQNTDRCHAHKEAAEVSMLPQTQSGATHQETTSMTQ